MNKRNAQSNKVVAAHCEKIVWEVQETGKLARTLQERCNMLWQNADVRYEFARNFEVRKVLQQRFNLDGSPQLTSLSFRCYALHWSEYLCRWYIASSFYPLDESWLWHIQIHIMTYYDCRFAGLWWLTDTAWKISVWSNRYASRFCQSRRWRPLCFPVGHLLSAFNDDMMSQVFERSGCIVCWWSETSCACSQSMLSEPCLTCPFHVISPFFLNFRFPFSFSFCYLALEGDIPDTWQKDATKAPQSFILRWTSHQRELQLQNAEDIYIIII